jgi:hypothetical protein
MFTFIKNNYYIIYKMMPRSIYICILIYIIFICSLFTLYNNNCKNICEAELLGNLMNCLDMDPNCYQYYYSIYKECINKC